MAPELADYANSLPLRGKLRKTLRCVSRYISLFTLHDGIESLP
jgi:hypothetical protein